METPPLPMLEPLSGLPPKKLKARHGFLFTWLTVMIAADLVTIVIELIGRSALGAVEEASTKATLPPEPEWFIYGIVALASVDIFCVLCLFFWKKWAFYGSVAAASGAMALRIYADKPLDSCSTALFMTAVLFVALQLGDENNGWHRLK